jgi:RNA-binding protein NOB1
LFFIFIFLFGSLAGYLHVYVLTFALVQFSLPLPQGGRDAIIKNMILREDQLPQKFLYPKTKKKANKQVSVLLYGNCFCSSIFFLQNLSGYLLLIIIEATVYLIFQGDDFYSMDDFGQHSDKRGPLQPPVRKALAVFSGRRNPNDNHYARSKRK